MKKLNYLRYLWRNNKYRGKNMRKKPIVAIIYDFDGTLSPGNMQEFGFIQAVGKTKEEFWRAVADQLRLLTDQDYYVLFRMDDCGVYVIEYEHDPHIEEWGYNRFMYVTPEEENEVISNRVYGESGSEE